MFVELTVGLERLLDDAECSRGQSFTLEARLQSLNEDHERLEEDLQATEASAHAVTISTVGNAIIDNTNSSPPPATRNTSAATRAQKLVLLCQWAVGKFGPLRAALTCMLAGRSRLEEELSTVEILHSYAGGELYAGSCGYSLLDLRGVHRFGRKLAEVWGSLPEHMRDISRDGRSMDDTASGEAKRLLFVLTYLEQVVRVDPTMKARRLLAMWNMFSTATNDGTSSDSRRAPKIIEADTHSPKAKLRAQAITTKSLRSAKASENSVARSAPSVGEANNPICSSTATGQHAGDVYQGLPEAGQRAMVLALGTVAMNKAAKASKRMVEPQDWKAPSLPASPQRQQSTHLEKRGMSKAAYSPRPSNNPQVRRAPSRTGSPQERQTAPPKARRIAPISQSPGGRIARTLLYESPVEYRPERSAGMQVVKSPRVQNADSSLSKSSSPISLTSVASPGKIIGGELPSHFSRASPSLGARQLRQSPSTHSVKVQTDPRCRRRRPEPEHEPKSSQLDVMAAEGPATGIALQRSSKHTEQLQVALQRAQERARAADAKAAAAEEKVADYMKVQEQLRKTLTQTDADHADSDVSRSRQGENLAEQLQAALQQSQEQARAAEARAAAAEEKAAHYTKVEKQLREALTQTDADRSDVEASRSSQDENKAVQLQTALQQAQQQARAERAAAAEEKAADYTKPEKQLREALTQTDADRSDVEAFRSSQDEKQAEQLQAALQQAQEQARAAEARAAAADEKAAHYTKVEKQLCEALTQTDADRSDVVAHPSSQDENKAEQLQTALQQAQQQARAAEARAAAAEKKVADYTKAEKQLREALTQTDADRSDVEASRSSQDDKQAEQLQTALQQAQEQARAAVARAAAAEERAAHYTKEEQELHDALTQTDADRSDAEAYRSSKDEDQAEQLQTALQQAQQQVRAAEARAAAAEQKAAEYTKVEKELHEALTQTDVDISDAEAYRSRQDENQAEQLQTALQQAQAQVRAAEERAAAAEAKSADHSQVEKHLREALKQANDDRSDADASQTGQDRKHAEQLQAALQQAQGEARAAETVAKSEKERADACVADAERRVCATEELAAAMWAKTEQAKRRLSQKRIHPSTRMLMPHPLGNASNDNIGVAVADGERPSESTCGGEGKGVEECVVAAPGELCADASASPVAAGGEGGLGGREHMEDRPREPSADACYGGGVGNSSKDFGEGLDDGGTADMGAGPIHIDAASQDNSGPQSFQCQSIQGGDLANRCRRRSLLRRHQQNQTIFPLLGRRLRNREDAENAQDADAEHVDLEIEGTEMHEGAGSKQEKVPRAKKKGKKKQGPTKLDNARVHLNVGVSSLRMQV